MKPLLPSYPPVYSIKPQQKIIFPEKIWLHRVNALSRAINMAKEYLGLEIDIVFDESKNYFDAVHPPTESIQLSLERIFSSIPNVSNHYFWLDYKNLKEGNKIKSCELMLEMTNKYQIKNNVIIESPNPEALTHFTEQGFYTSYYIPTFDIEKCNTDELKRYYEIVKSHLLKSKVHALSSHSKSLPFIEKYFPDKDILLWHIDEQEENEKDAAISYFKQNEKIKVVLIHKWSSDYR